MHPIFLVVEVGVVKYKYPHTQNENAVGNYKTCSALSVHYAHHKIAYHWFKNYVFFQGHVRVLEPCYFAVLAI